MTETKHDLYVGDGESPNGSAGELATANRDECTSSEELRKVVERCLRLEKARGLRLAARLARKYGSQELLPELLDAADKYDGRDWLWALGKLWTSIGWISIHGDLLFAEVIQRADNDGGGIRELMSREEQAAFEALPDELVIYRGCGPRNMFGFSWTLDCEIAAKFPFTRRHQADEPLLLTARIPKRLAAAIKLNGEQEIIVFDYADEPSFTWTVEPLETPADLRATPVSVCEDLLN